MCVRCLVCKKWRRGDVKKLAALNVIDFRLIRSELGSHDLDRVVSPVLFWSKAFRAVESLFTSLFTSDVKIYVNRKKLLRLGISAGI